MSTYLEFNRNCQGLVAVSHNCVACIANSDNISSVFEQLQALSRRLKYMYDGDSKQEADQLGSCDLRHLAVLETKLELALCEGDDGLLSCLREMLNRKRDERVPSGVSPKIQCVPKDQDRLDQALRVAVASLTWQQRIRLLEQSLEGYNGTLNEETMHIVTLILLSKKKGLDDYCKTRLSTAINSICQRLQGTENFKAAMYLLKCLAAFFFHHPRDVRQSHIDNTLGTFETVAHRLSGCIVEKESGYLFTCLTRAFKVILQSFRVQIGGRYHQVISALQALLRCLFTPYPSTVDEPELETAFTAQDAEVSEVSQQVADPPSHL